MRRGVLLAAWLLIGSCLAQGDPLAVPDGVVTHADGRAPLVELLASYRPLLEAGWIAETITLSQPGGAPTPLPIVAFRTPIAGPAAWYITGIHGEEPAGPNALAQSVETLLELGERLPVVVVPLANPWGYVRHWRYLNMPTWSPDAEAQSVGDASHWLEDAEHPGQARAERASSDEAEALTTWVLKRTLTHPPRWSIDLHEDNLIDRGYVYSQGVEGTTDPLATFAVSILRETGIAVQMSGETRFGEAIEAGIIGPVTDSSIDELMSAATVIAPSGSQPGPAAKTVLVFETPAALSLAQRVAAHRALIEALSRQMQP
jgi:hypothetical protein